MRVVIPHDTKRSKLAVAIATSTLVMSGSPLAMAEDEDKGRALEGIALEEVVVTATRRAQSVQDIPYNISAVSGDALKNAGVADLNSLTRMIPGLANADLGPRSSSINSSLIIRGLNANNAASNAIWPNVSASPVSTYVDETPLFVNLKLADIERVEVLRGPQGTLYGSGSVGGTLRFIFNKPSTEEASAEISAKMVFQDESDDETYSVDAIGNLPLSDNVAVRASVGYEDIGGVVDAKGHVVTDASGAAVLADPFDPMGSGMLFSEDKDADSAEVKYIRASLLWDINEDVELIATYHRQENQADDQSVQAIGGEEYEHFQRLPEPLESDVDMYSLEVTADIGFATFSSSTSYTENNFEASPREGSGVLQQIDDNAGGWIYGGFPRLVGYSDEKGVDEAVTQEFRLVSNTEGKWDWVLGGFYRKQEQSLEVVQTVPGYDDWSELSGHSIAALVGEDSWADLIEFYYGGVRPVDQDRVYGMFRDTSFEDVALFGELTYHVTDAWQMTFGMRKFWQEFDQSLFQDLPNCGGFCSTDGLDPRGSSEASNSESFQDQIFKFNTSFDINDSTMVYFTWAEGFRHGGANALPLDGFFGEDASLLPFDSDMATNWEVGLKGTLGDQVRYTMSLYRIDWEAVQLDGFTSPGAFAFVLNGDEARSQGMELEINAQLTENTSLTVGYSYVDASLNGDFQVETVIGNDGDPLPSVPKHQASLALDHFQPLENGMELHYHLDSAYRSGIQTSFNDQNTGYFELDGFAMWNGSVSMQLNDRINVGLFVNNITGENGAYARLSRTTANTTFQNVEWMTRPRSYGLNFRYTF